MTKKTGDKEEEKDGKNDGKKDGKNDLKEGGKKAFLLGGKSARVAKVDSLRDSLALDNSTYGTKKKQQSQKEKVKAQIERMNSKKEAFLTSSANFNDFYIEDRKKQSQGLICFLLFLVPSIYNTTKNSKSCGN